jgi:hypothetical protein
MKKFFKVVLIALVVLVGALYVWLNFNVSYELKLACEGEQESWVFWNGVKSDLEKENANAYIRINKYKWWYPVDADALLQGDILGMHIERDVKFIDTIGVIEFGNTLGTTNSGTYQTLSKRLSWSFRGEHGGSSFEGTCTESKN